MKLNFIVSGESEMVSMSSRGQPDPCDEDAKNAQSAAEASVSASLSAAPHRPAVLTADVLHRQAKIVKWMMVINITLQSIDNSLKTSMKH